MKKPKAPIRAFAGEGNSRNIFFPQCRHTFNIGNGQNMHGPGMVVVSQLFLGCYVPESILMSQAVNPLARDPQNIWSNSSETSHQRLLKKPCTYKDKQQPRKQYRTQSREHSNRTTKKNVQSSRMFSPIIKMGKCSKTFEI